MAAEQLCHGNPFPRAPAHPHRPELRGASLCPWQDSSKCAYSKPQACPSSAASPGQVTQSHAQRPPVSPSSFLPLLFEAPKLLTEGSELTGCVFSTLFPSEGGTEQGKEKTSQGAIRGTRPRRQTQPKGSQPLQEAWPERKKDINTQKDNH